MRLETISMQFSYMAMMVIAEFKASYFPGTENPANLRSNSAVIASQNKEKTRLDV